MEAHLQRDFHRRRTVVCKKTPLEPLRRQLDQTFAQLDHGLVAESGQDDVLELLQLVANGRIDAGIGVAEEIDPPGAHRVDVAVTFEILQPDAFAPFYRNGGKGFAVLHLCAGVPQHAKVALNER